MFQQTFNSIPLDLELKKQYSNKKKKKYIAGIFHFFAPSVLQFLNSFTLQHSRCDSMFVINWEISRILKYVKI